ncbi:unnamed protein product [Rotaria magnacalcarata]
MIFSFFEQVINNAFDEYTLPIRETYGIDQGLESILGKAKVQVRKIAVGLHAVSLAAAIFDQLINDDSLPGYYDKNVEGVVLYDNGITTNISHSNGQSYSRRSLKIKDDTGTINITIWNEKIVEVLEQVVNKTIRMRNGKINHYHGPVHETLDEMRQRFEQNRDEQERIERNHEVLAESRRSKVSMRSDDGSEQRYPEKVILLARGLLTKEKNTGAHRATTYFSKVLIDQKWDVETLTIFCTKLAKYNVSLVAYRASLKPEITVSTTETEDDDSMDAFPRREDVLIRMSPPPVPSRNLIQTTTTPIASYGFRLPPSVNSVRSQQRIETQATQSFSTNDMETTEITTSQLAPQAKKKNRIEQIDKPTSPFSSPRRHIPKSQEYPYQNV